MPASSIDFVSLGMVVLDELRLPDGRTLQNCIGGSGAYSTLGARIVTNSPESVGSFILAGNDFPDEVTELIRGWGLTSELKLNHDRNSTRGLLKYLDEDFGRKSFRYTTDPLQPFPRDLPPTMLSSQSFHMLYRPPVLISEIEQLLQLRSEIGIREKPIVVWEPFPSLCMPENLGIHVDAFKVVDVFSPNHLELLGLFGEPANPFNSQAIERYARRILDASTATSRIQGQHHAVVVRAGEHGCFVISQQTEFWLPPYHKSSSKVVDATGGGNTFLGAFTITLQRTGDLRRAAIAGSVAASFAIEQIGLPQRTQANGMEYWNGESVQKRLESYDNTN
ncbi:putative Carbohydrate kinase PfkB domain-containing protein [Seiridium unicorne]|uniref:Carbohydrate kinase PfkB domain-containing protein n=1 Tax=Seiridium unicorne TaxID=138068 RepID=A0ABR2UHU0_9PEZI